MVEGLELGLVPFRLDNKWINLKSFENVLTKVWIETKIDGKTTYRVTCKLKILKNVIKRCTKEEGIKEAVQTNYPTTDSGNG